MSRRYRKRRLKRSYPNEYDSGFEYDLHCGPLKGCTLHPDPIDYTIERKYQADFVHPSEDNLLIEAKGRFRDNSEATKYIWFSKSNPEYRLVFIFSDSNKPMPGAKPRKTRNGTKMSHGEWAEKNGFEYYDIHNIPKEWSK